MSRFRVLDLFSGVGAFSLGLEGAGGFETVAFCEPDQFCQRVLNKHWPKVPIYDDIRNLTASRLAADGIVPDVVCGGFPCQDISYAGEGAGLDGERSGLWFEYARLIRELQPHLKYVLVENVAALVGRGLGRVLWDLADIGFDAEWSTVSACSVGAPHMRQRVFIVAYPNRVDGRPGVWDTASQTDWAIQADNRLARARTRWRARMANPSELYRGADGLPDGMDRNHAIGNSITPDVPELIGGAILAAERAAA